MRATSAPRHSCDEARRAAKTVRAWVGARARELEWRMAGSFGPDTVRRSPPDLMAAGDELEGLQPKVARGRGRTSGPWLEYPWETPAGVTTPGESLPNLERYGTRRAPTVALLTSFAAEIIRKHEELFG